MNWAALLSLIAKLVGPLLAYLWAREGEAKRKAQDDAKAAIERNKVEDDINKYAFGNRRRMLSRWSVPWVASNPTDDER